MIINLKKYLFFGSKEDLSSFFIKAQDEGFVEFITDRKKGKDLPDDVRKLMVAIKVLRKQPIKEAYRGGGDLAFADEIASQVLDLTHEIEKLSEEKRFLDAEISRVRPFGEFSFDDIVFIEEKTGKKVQFYCVKTSKTHEIEEAKSLIYVGTDYDLDYFVGIHDVPKTFSGMIEMHFDRTAGELRNHLAFVDETLHQMEAELKGYAGHLEFLRDSLLGQLDIHTLEKTQKEVAFPIEGSLFSIEAWVPDNKLEELPKLTKDLAIAFEPIAIEKDDKIPTYMENENYNRIGEDLVRIYDIPASTDKDPSGWVLWAFALFFAMILADGGYGALYLGLAFFLKYKFPNLKNSGKRFLKLLFILSTSCVIWGVITTSFFGIEIAPQSPLSSFSVLNRVAEKKAEYHAKKNDEVHKEWVEKYPQIAGVKSGKEMLQKAFVVKNKVKKYEMLNEFSDNILLEFSLFVGVIHVSISLLRYLRRKWANIGWVLFSIGGYLYFPVTLKATSIVEFLGGLPKDTAAMVGIQLLYGGIGLAVVLAFIQRKLKGIGEIAEIIQVFADILSYLRLYALALASSIMARTFNEMGIGVGLVVGSAIILAGHSVNILLGTMGGVIHGLRLNFIEWYHYSFDGEGRLFNPLRKLKMKQE
ncbi:MAG: V-type ATP synthase subunit I [Simkaniaceae bacterium]|nr:V-type ATP synthase subunit I [Candidatus Sacchlamyda saccharinae]